MIVDFEALKNAVSDLNENKLNLLLREFLATGPDSVEALAVLEACQQGMEIVGERFENGDYFVGDLVFAGAMLASALEKLKPVIGYDTETANRGVVVLGTVQGDVHYIGKNVYKVMLEAAGYKVYDIGIDQPPEAFVETALRVNADIIGLSGLLTVSVESMKRTVDAIRKAGLPRHIRIEIGGSIVNEDAKNYTGADAWNVSAYDAVRKNKQRPARKPEPEKGSEE
ncbi:MAG: cobalamin-dependent protein [Clostridiales Family XIII bacterium]|jgi:methylmalonyl-CoA mutase cobalamin-binding domain/chain|nr:cobalamin-dependent protein [Clostridiales Family XIII bacterium]